jgi:hypothetical protein
MTRKWLKILILGSTIVMLALMPGCGSSGSGSNPPSSNPVPAEQFILGVSSVTDSTVTLQFISTTITSGEWIYRDGIPQSVIMFTFMTPILIPFPNDKAVHCYQVGKGQPLPGKPVSNKICT